VKRKVRKEYNDTMRRLGDFVTKRDKRVIDMRVKRSGDEEEEKGREEEEEEVAKGEGLGE